MTSENGNFTPVFHLLAKEVGLVCAAVYGATWRHCQMKDNNCKASLDTLGDEIGVDRATVMRSIKKLCELGYLLDQTPGRRNAPHTYILGKSVALCNSLEVDSVAQDNSSNPTVAECNATVAESHLKIDSKIESKEIREEKEEKEFPQENDSRWAAVWKLWTANIHLSESPVVIQEMQQEKYLNCPLEWWQQIVTIMGRNRVFTWNYAKSILDRSIEAKESPDIMGPPPTKYDRGPTRPAQSGKRFDNPKTAGLPLLPSPDLPPPAPIPRWAELWEKAAGLLRGQMTQATYEQIISHLEARPNHNGTFILAAPPGTCEQVRRLDKRILIALQQFKPEIKGIEVITQ